MVFFPLEHLHSSSIKVVIHSYTHTPFRETSDLSMQNSLTHKNIYSSLLAPKGEKYFSEVVSPLMGIFNQEMLSY